MSGEDVHLPVELILEIHDFVLYSQIVLFFIFCPFLQVLVAILDGFDLNSLIVQELGGRKHNKELGAFRFVPNVTG